MKLTCADCGFESDEAIVRDGLGWKGFARSAGSPSMWLSRGVGRDDVRG